MKDNDPRRNTGMFHYRDGLYFGRRLDGSVRIVKFECGGRVPHAMWFHTERAVTEPAEYPLAEGEFTSVYVMFDVTIPLDGWASIVASVSAGGESNGRFYEARRMHEEFHRAIAATPPDGSKV